MTDWLLGLVPAYGVWLLTAATFLSCLALPIPASILMLAAGGFAAVGDLSLPVILFGALAGAVAGDQIGYLAGRKGGAGLLARMHHKNAPLKNTPLQKAVALLARRGGGAVFFSRWLVSALGPYINLAAGAAAATLGEVHSIWRCRRVGLGLGLCWHRLRVCRQSGRRIGDGG